MVKTLKHKKVDYIIAIPSYKRAETLRDKSLTVLKEYNISPTCIDIFVANKDEEEEYSMEDLIQFVEEVKNRTLH